LLSNDYFYFSSIRKYVAIFGSTFNNIVINRTDGQGNITQIINVPISYAQKEKMMVRMKEDAGISKQAAIILPRMSFYLDGITYAANRKMNTVNKLIYPSSDVGSGTFTYESVPWDLHFTLYVYVKNSEDGTKIIEQILPFFTPEFTVRAFMIPNHESFDVPIELKMVSHENSDSEKFSDNSVLIWSLNFTVRGSFFGPVKSTKYIELANTAVYFGTFDQANTANSDTFGLSRVIVNTATTGNNTLQGYVTVQAGVDTSNNIVTDWDSILTTYELE
jgi:hypothetical protein